MSVPGSICGGLSLFRHFPDLNYFAKDREGAFIAANAGFVEMSGLASEAQLLGKTDFDVWPRFLAEHYVKDDARTMSASAPLINKIELVLRRDRPALWFATTKVPLLGPGGDVIGIEGVCRYLKQAKPTLEQALKLPAVIDYIMENYPRKIDVPTLAAMACLSVRQFERSFRKEYGASPLQYVQRIRLDAARQLLAMTRLPISQIGRETGFYDSSHFSHHFTKYTGLSPIEYRKQNRP